MKPLILHAHSIAQTGQRSISSEDILATCDALALAVVILNGAQPAWSMSFEARRLASTVVGDAVIEQARDLAMRAVGETRHLSIGPARVKEVTTLGGRGTLRVSVLQRGAAPVVAVVIEAGIDRGGGASTAETFTVRERDVANLLASGRSNKEIAARLGISAHTARHHTERVFAKLGVRSRAAAAAALGIAPVDAAV